MNRPEVGLVLVGGGTSRRMGGTDKIWADLGGMPLVAHSMRTLSPRTRRTVLVLREEHLASGMRAGRPQRDRGGRWRRAP